MTPTRSVAVMTGASSGIGQAATAALLDPAGPRAGRIVPAGVFDKQVRQRNRMAS